MLGRLDDGLAHVTVEEACGGDVSRLEETGQRRQPREALRVGSARPMNAAALACERSGVSAPAPQ
jgi:hypothetical protein